MKGSFSQSEFDLLQPFGYREQEVVMDSKQIVVPSNTNKQIKVFSRTTMELEFVSLFYSK